MKRLALFLALATNACAAMSSGPPMWVEAKGRYIDDDGPVCVCDRFPDPDACDPGNPHPHEPVITDDGCETDGPALSPAAAKATEAKRAKLGATDNGKDIAL